MDFTGERVVPGKTPESVYVEHVARYNFALAYGKGKTVLDVACGTGYGTAILASAAGSVVGIDLDRETIAYARENYPHPKVTYLLGDILQLPLPDESVEVVACFETIEHVVDDRKCLQELRRVLQPGGICLLSTPNRAVFSPGKTLSDQPHNIFHCREYTLDEFRDLVQQYFQEVKIYGQYANQIWAITGVPDSFQPPAETPHFFLALCKKGP